MESKKLIAWAFALIGGLTLDGCQKISPAEISPATKPTAQTLTRAETTESLTPVQSAWLQFLSKVDAGVVIDVSGQYVANGTKVLADGTGHRLMRPKYDAASPDFSKHYVVRYSPQSLAGTEDSNSEAAKRISSPSLGTTSPDTPTTNFIQPCDPCGGGGGSPTVYSFFTSSEGIAPYSGSDNPNGYVWDLKIGYGGSQFDHFGIPDSYTIINQNLNAGAGGDWIYIGYTRVPSNVSESPEVIYGSPYNTGPITLLGTVRKESFFDPWPYFATNSYPVWVDTGRRLGFEEHDLNENAGGYYIRAKLSRDPAYGPPLEIGVLQGNSSTIQPPTGWTRVGGDLNQGAGGAFVYFCTKQR